jgi:hypothetical protein
MLRELNAGVLVPLLIATERGREPDPVLLWRLRCGLSQLRRLGRWSDDERKYLLAGLEAVAQSLDRHTLVSICIWLQDRLHDGLVDE